MKKLGIFFALTILLAGGAMVSMASLSQAQVLAPPPPLPLASPWVGANTPWVFYNGDWFAKGILYYYFGPKYGWAPYYAYPRVYVARPASWYAPKWNAWYKANPAYWNQFQQKYPHWRTHRVGHHYDEAFYNRYHRSQGRGWHSG
jgi:hypothetical protein